MLKRVSYVVYGAKDGARIGKYATENGNERDGKCFVKEFPGLSECTIRILT